MRREKRKLNAEELRAKSIRILAKKGYLPDCKCCGTPSDRREADGLCSKCLKDKDKIEKEAQEKLRVEREREEAAVKRAEIYKGREGMWG